MINMNTVCVVVLVIVNSVILATNADPVAQIYLNSNTVAAIGTSLGVKEYDVMALYYFKDGETVAIECKLLQVYADYLRMKYYNSTGGILLETFDSLKPIGLQIKLTQESHSNYLDCYYSYYNYYHVTRLFFKSLRAVVENSNSDISVHINGMYVRPTGAVYQHLYYAGERTDITCHIGNYDFINLDYNGRIRVGFSKATISLYLDKNNNNSHVTCTALNKHTQETIETVRVHLIQSVSNLYITGLNKANILMQYRNRMHILVIHYQFSNNEELNLNCSSSKYAADKLRWTFNESSVASTEQIRSGNTSTHLRVVLQASYDYLTIKCTVEPNYLYSGNQIIIRLEHKTEPDIVDYDFASKYWIWIAGSIIMTIITIIIIFCLMKKCKNKRIKSRSCEEEPEGKPIGEPIPRMSQEICHCHGAMSSVITPYSEVYYEPTFGGRRTPTHTDNEYAYADCSHLGERHASAFDAVASRIALEEAKRTNKSEYINLGEVCRSGHCVMRAHHRK